MASKGGLPQRELLIYWISARSTAKSQGKEECKLVPYVKAVHLFSCHRSSPICDISFKGTLCTKGYVLPPCVGLKKNFGAAFQCSSPINAREYYHDMKQNFYLQSMQVHYRNSRSERGSNWLREFVVEQDLSDAKRKPKVESKSKR